MSECVRENGEEGEREREEGRGRESETSVVASNVKTLAYMKRIIIHQHAYPNPTHAHSYRPPVAILRINVGL